MAGKVNGKAYDLKEKGENYDYHAYDPDGYDYDFGHFKEGEEAYCDDGVYRDDKYRAGMADQVNGNTYHLNGSTVQRLTRPK